jgi:hypothetical protein
MTLLQKIKKLNFYDFLKNLKEILTELVSSETQTYKVYSALLTQSGTDAPVAVILENTIGDIVWTREDGGIGTEGMYKGTLLGAFTAGKSVCAPYSSNFNSVGTSNIHLPLSTNGNLQTGWVTMYFGGTNDEDYLEIDTYDMTDRAEWSTVLGEGNLFIEIRVYA